jgi:pyruvate dehydrogenase E1 component alpha subunit
VNKMMAELYGRSGGHNGGKGGSMHIADFSVGMLGANGVVAAGMAIACGAAQALKVRHLPQVVACFFGDGAINRGPFLEALNWAAVYKLPVLFVCEDNRYSATTDTAAMTAGEGAAARARAIGVPAETCDGNDVEAVFALAQRLLADVRAGSGPRLLHALTWRVKGHVSVDGQAYRAAADIDAAMAGDPLLRARERLIALGMPPADIERIDAGARTEIAAAQRFAEESPPPDPQAAYTDVQTAGAGTWR